MPGDRTPALTVSVSPETPPASFTTTELTPPVVNPVVPPVPKVMVVEKAGAASSANSANVCLRLKCILRTGLTGPILGTSPVLEKCLW